jgi:ParB/RepB/Spo0J family partition protein
MTTQTKKRQTKVAPVAPKLPAITKSLPKAKKGTGNVPESSDDFPRIPLDVIDASPFNYRTYFDPVEVKGISESMKIRGVISPITVRIVVEGRYELAVGDVRVRAAREAGLIEIPAVIRVLTDDEVVEMQLSENINRSNPHAMDEAHGIGKLLKLRKTHEEIAARFGKSAGFVADRIKLLDLIPDLQEVFRTVSFEIKWAINMAGLAPESQQALFDTYCKGWRDTEHFTFKNLDKILASYRCSLQKASFDITDEKLVPKARACSNCSFNSACAGRLFHDEIGDAICMNRPCFEEKTKAHLQISFSEALEIHQAKAIVYSNKLPDEITEVLALIPGASELPTYEEYSITEVLRPKMPTQEQYTYTKGNGRMVSKEDDCDEEDDKDYDEDEDNDYDEDEDENDYDEDENEDNDHDEDEDDYDEDENEDEDEDNDEPGNTAWGSVPRQTEEREKVFDEARYNAAMAEYSEDMEKFNASLESDSTLIRGIRFNHYGKNIQPIIFKPEPRYPGYGPKPEKVTAAAVQKAIKEGTVTRAMLEGEIERIKTREERSKELDREKVQSAVHDVFRVHTSNTETVFTLSDPDRTAIRWIVYEALDYHDKERSIKALFPGFKGKVDGEEAFTLFGSMTDEQTARLVRMAIIGHKESTAPKRTAAHFLYKMAERSVDVLTIEDTQAEKAEERQENQQASIKKLEKRLRKFPVKA